MEEQMTTSALASAVVPRPRSEARHDLMLRRIRSEYREMPGHALSVRQAERMWNLPHTECDGLLRELVDAGFLLRTEVGLFVRADAGHFGA
jgi:hypothetical protein